ncbi:NAD(P)/FAD-dependent oxidoreductase [Rhizobium sp. S152]|uniref:flavin-containing monooxygenase n=1 Tax=Rhizobium sp. S152 TaxID=3055038 RepID=UPI0025A94BF1|nr:NAD(P)/FAD-dependent oxidoreductase [Rhizobium sp. S152]MDM9629052.1 NAD(P)/FAD-dependent oxidoreductase [Rhizobium sp. S152]
MAGEIVIVGAGPAGLACAAALRVRGRASIILEAADRIGASWHGHYDRLHLHTSKAHSALPGRPMPTSFPRYPSRLQVIEYLEEYACAEQLHIRIHKRVTFVQREGNWVVGIDDGEKLRTNVVIVATGLSHTPIKPRWADETSFDGVIMHSSEYHNAAALNGRKVLVVGFGNSAGEIALECASAGLTVAMSVRGGVNVVPRELLGIPSATIAIAQRYLPSRVADGLNAPLLRLRYSDLAFLGLRLADKGPLRTMVERGRTPLIDIGTIAAIRKGDIRVFPGISSVAGSTVQFENGQSFECDAIVLATGYVPALSGLLPDIVKRFPETSRPNRGDLHPHGDGLYFCGFNPAAAGLLRQIGIEADAIACSILRRLG